MNEETPIEGTEQEEYPIENLDFLTIEQTGRILQVSSMTVKRYIHRSENPLPAISMSNQEIRIKKSDLYNWMEALPDPRKNV